MRRDRVSHRQSTRGRIAFNIRGRVALLLALLVPVAACDTPSTEESTRLASSDTPLRATRGYVLISIDTLRADHLGSYGYARETSPFLDTLADRGVLFEQAVAQIPSTLPSHVSMLTGLHPREHGVHPPAGRIPESIETLAERFGAGGFRTAGITDGGYMAGSFGFDRGFDVFVDRFPDAPRRRRIEAIFGRGREFLRGLEDDEPFFLFLHTYAVHDPYDPPDDYRHRFWKDPAPETLWEPTGPNLTRFNCGFETLDERGRDYFVALYDAGIRYTDDVLADFFADLEAMQLADEVTVVLTSDHGEEFLEHGLLGHEQVYHHNLHVPLIVVHPDARPHRVRGLARLTDLFPTFVDLADLDSPGEPGPRSLRTALEGAPTTGRRASYVQASTGTGQGLYPSVAEGSPRQLQLVEHRSPRGGSWITPRGVVFQASGPSTTLLLRAFLRPRTVQILVDGQPRDERRIERLVTPDALDPPERVEIHLPDDGRPHRVELRAEDGCDPATLMAAGDCRCFSLQVGWLPQGRRELYDVDTDPRQQTDLSPTLREDVARLAEELDTVKQGLRPVADPETHELDPEVRARLEALGYL